MCQSYGQNTVGPFFGGTRCIATLGYYYYYYYYIIIIMPR